MADEEALADRIMERDFPICGVPTGLPGGMPSTTRLPGGMSGPCTAAGSPQRAMDCGREQRPDSGGVDEVGTGGGGIAAAEVEAGEVAEEERGGGEEEEGVVLQGVVLPLWRDRWQMKQQLVGIARDRVFAYVPWPQLQPWLQPRIRLVEQPADVPIDALIDAPEYVTNEKAISNSRTRGALSR